jgi:solute carrier family 25 (mitochondrial adenine nucleotide translocator), member 4/5/6/31
MDFLKSFAAGGISGAVAKTCTAPIERVKLIIQTQDANPRIISGEIPRYTGIGNVFTRVASEQGIGAFWRGNFVNILRYFPTQAFNFAFKDSIKALFPKSKNNMTKFAINMASGGLAGAGSLTIVYPLDYARTRLASDVGSGKKAFNGLADCLKKTATGPGGVMALYGGFGVSVVGIIPFRGTYFGVNDTLAEMNPFQSRSDMVGLASKFAQAQTAALCAAYVSYPFDTIRRRLQMQSEKAKEDWMYKGTMDCFRKVMADEGTSALFKGAGANALRTVGSALVLVGYGELMILMGAGNLAGGGE